MADPDASEQRIDYLLSNMDIALKEWYVTNRASRDPDLILTSPGEPSSDSMGQIFDRWVHRRRDDLRSLLCEKIGYGKVRKGTKEISELVLITAVASSLAIGDLNVVDPVVTATILVARRSLDRICD